MSALLFFLVLALQGIPLQAQQAGTVSGVLKDTAGKPVAGIRMAAIARPQSLDEAITSPAMSSLAETDEQGRYTLESIPPGRYLIAAGRLDAQTYYPGTSDPGLAKEVAITPGTKVSGIDFTLGDSSFGRAGTGGTGGATVAVPLRVTIEGGARMPVSAGGKFISVKLDMGTSVIATPITSTFINVPGPQTTAYRVTVENLPETYVVKSITYGTTDLSTTTLRLTPANFTPPFSLNAGTPAATTAAPGPTPLPATGVLPQDPAALQAYLAGMAASALGLRIQAAAAAGVPSVGITVGAQTAVPQPAVTPPSLLSIRLAPLSSKPAGGIRVSGRMSAGGSRTVYVSGIPGTVYSDGTFEVYGIPPGRHSIVTRDSASGLHPLGASVVVETSNLDGIVLAETAMLPIRAWEAAPPRPAGGHPVGSVPLARLTGTLVEELSKQPIAEGTVNVRSNGYYSASFPVDAEGHFELPPLLPGTYDLEVQIFGHSNIKKSVEIDDKDMKLELFSRKLY